MPDLPKLTEADIRRWTGDQSFARGSRYFSDGAIRNPRLAGSTLKAQCQGSQIQPYGVQATLGSRDILAANCSCPIGSGGHCKHVAALLLTWLDDPDEFVCVEDLATNLDRRSKADLIALIGKMVERHPDLEMLIELPVPGHKNTQPVDAENIRRQVRHALFSGGDEWDAAPQIAGQLASVVDVGDGYAESEGWSNAVIVYETIIRTVLQEFDSFDDEGGDLREIVNRCVQGLGDCVSVTEDPAHRSSILRALFETYAWDVEHGGIEVGYQAPGIILEQATPEERAQVAAWLRAVLPTGDSWTHSFQRQTYGGFLLHLEQDTIDDEAWLRICRETDRVLDLVDRLLALQRVGEAREVAQAAGDYDLLRMAEIFEAHGQLDPVAGLIRERATVSKDSRLAEWLKQQAIERGDHGEGLAWAQQLFWQNPSLERYDQAKSLAQVVGRWDGLQAEILSHLAEQKQYALLIEVYLKEGQVDRALATVKSVQNSRWLGVRPDLIIEVAAAAEETEPRESIRIYTDRARQLINARGRQSYIDAADYLARVRRLYQHLGNEAAWHALITDIRAQNTRLRALKEELSRLDL
jgi:hypothetical protein